MSAAVDPRRALMSADVLTTSNGEDASVARAVEQPAPQLEPAGDAKAALQSAAVEGEP